MALDRLADGGFAEVEVTLDGDAESLLLYRQGDDVRAWLNICPHAGRRLDWAPGQFLKRAGTAFWSAPRTAQVSSSAAADAWPGRAVATRCAQCR